MAINRSLYHYIYLTLRLGNGNLYEAQGKSGGPSNGIAIVAVGNILIVVENLKRSSRTEIMDKDFDKL